MNGIWTILLGALCGYFMVAYLVPTAPGFFRHLLRVSMGTGIGLGLISMCFFLFRTISTDARTSACASLAIIAVATTALVATRKRFPELFLFIPTRQREDAFLGLFCGACVTMAFAINLPVFGTILWLRPFGDYDALAVWNLRAKFLALCSPEHFRDAFSPLLVYAHTDYPPLLPGIVAHMWSVAGQVTAFAPMAVASLFFLSLPLMMLSTFATQRRYFQAGLIALSTLGGMNYLELSALEYADLPLSFFVGSTLCATVLGFVSGSARPFFLAGLCAGLAALTKNEGTPWLAISVVSISVAVVAARGETWKRRLLLLFCGFAAPVAVLILFKTALAGKGDQTPHTLQALGTQLRDTRRLSDISTFFLTHVPNFLNWTLPPAIPLLISVPFIGISLRGGTGISAIVALLAAVGMVATYFLAFVVTPYDPRWLMAFTVDRLFLQIWPAMVLPLVLVLAPPRRA